MPAHSHDGQIPAKAPLREPAKSRVTSRKQTGTDPSSQPRASQKHPHSQIRRAFSDFDCSGLTAWAWRQVGVSLPDYSYSQWDVTARISREQLQPGDLVFWFGGDVHHVAIVVAVDVGRVRIAEAANPDAGVRIRDFGDSWDQRYVSGYGRVDHR